MKRLSDRQIVICGAASGIGARTAETFVKEDAKVMLLDRDKTQVAEMADQLGMPFGVVDITDPGSVTAAWRDAAKALGPIDGLVHTAGVCELGAIETLSLATWQRMIDVNLTGTFVMCQAAIPYLRGQPGATIVNVTSASGIKPSFSGGAYGASKAGADMFTKNLAMELAPGIRVNSICPGVVDTPLANQIMPMEGAEMDAILKANYALQRAASPQEIAQSILYLTSSDSSFLTGISLVADGGRTYH